MTYNIHPILVHFPIALLFLYSIIKILPFKRFFPRFAWRDAERVLLFFGVLGAFAALLTGPIAEHLVQPNHDLVETHAAFAATSTLLYLLLLIGEIFSIANVSFIPKKIPGLIKFGLFIEKILCHPILSKIIAFIGFCTITITGMLGGIMVYGLSIDPIAPHILHLLNITYP